MPRPETTPEAAQKPAVRRSNGPGSGNRNADGRTAGAGAPDPRAADISRARLGGQQTTPDAGQALGGRLSNGAGLQGSGGRIPPGGAAEPRARDSREAEPRPRLNIAFVLARRFTLSAYANFVDVLRLAADEGDRSRPILCRWTVVGSDRTPIPASCGTRIEPDARPDDPRQYDYVVVIGGLIGTPQPLAPDLTAFLHRAAAAGVALVGVCTGAFILAREGLMTGHRCCVSWFHHDDFLAEFAALEPVSDQIFVVDGNRLSCSGGVSAAHLAAFLVDRHIGRAAARKSLAIMMIDGPQGADHPQPGLPLELTTDDPLVRRALLALQQRIDSPPTVAALADLLGVGRRKLERHFAAALGLSPADAGVRIRLAQARMLLERTDRTVTQIADETGFCDASHLIRVFRDIVGETPERWRQKEARH